jgi:hypothetical protein
MSNTNTLKTQAQQVMEKITLIQEQKGMTPSSMITLIIPPKYCI